MRINKVLIMVASTLILLIQTVTYVSAGSIINSVTNYNSNYNEKSDSTIINEIVKENDSNKELGVSASSPETAKDIIVGTVRATGITFIPVIFALAISLNILGSLSSTLNFLVKTSMFMVAGAALGLILMFFAEPIVYGIINTI